MKSITVDLGGTNIKIGVLQDGLLLGQRSIPARAEKGLAPRLGDIADTINDLASESSAPLAGLAVSFPGIVDFHGGRIFSTPEGKYSDILEVDLHAWAQAEWGLSVALENDARMAMLGEWQYGAGRGRDNMVMMTLGTGIGTSAVIAGVPLRGAHFQAGVLGGHFVLDVEGRPCICGNHGCVETLASGWMLPEMMRSDPDFAASPLADEAQPDFAALFRHQDDPAARRLLDRCISVWAAAAINLIHAYDPEIIVISGGIMKSAALILPRLQQICDERAWTPWGKVRLKVAEYADSAALYGGHYLVALSSPQGVPLDDPGFAF